MAVSGMRLVLEWLRENGEAFRVCRRRAKREVVGRRKESKKRPARPRIFGYRRTF